MFRHSFQPIVWQGRTTFKGSWQSVAQQVAFAAVTNGVAMGTKLAMQVEHLLALIAFSLFCQLTVRADETVGMGQR